MIEQSTLIWVSHHFKATNRQASINFPSGSDLPMRQINFPCSILQSVFGVCYILCLACFSGLHAWRAYVLYVLIYLCFLCVTVFLRTLRVLRVFYFFRALHSFILLRVFIFFTFLHFCMCLHCCTRLSYLLSFSYVQDPPR